MDISPDASHVTINRGQYQETISRDRVELAPNHNFGEDSDELDRSEIRSDHRKDSAEYVLTDIIGHSVKEDNTKEWWYGFKRPTWDPIANVTHDQIIHYCHKYNEPRPDNFKDAIPGRPPT